MVNGFRRERYGREAADISILAYWFLLRVPSEALPLPSGLGEAHDPSSGPSDPSAVPVPFAHLFSVGVPSISDLLRCGCWVFAARQL